MSKHKDEPLVRNAVNLDLRSQKMTQRERERVIQTGCRIAEGLPRGSTMTWSQIADASFAAEKGER
jgi:hypothetical protein